MYFEEMCAQTSSQHVWQILPKTKFNTILQTQTGRIILGHCGYISIQDCIL